MKKRDKNICNFSLQSLFNIGSLHRTSETLPSVCQGRALGARGWEKVQKTMLTSSWIFLCLKLACAWVGELICESLILVTWNKFLFHRSLLSPGRKMVSVAVDPQPVWILDSCFLIPFPPLVFWEVNPLPHLDCRVWWPGWPTCPWWAPHTTWSPRPMSLQRISILAWSLCVRWRRRAWRPSRLWQWWVLSPSSRS